MRVVGVRKEEKGGGGGDEDVESEVFGVGSVWSRKEEGVQSRRGEI